MSAVLYGDLDSFKSVNDGLGRDAGDRLLAAVASRVQDSTGPADLAARLGGDEIGVLLTRVGGTREAEDVADRLLKVLRRPYVDDGREIMITASIGIAVLDAAPTGPARPSTDRRPSADISHAAAVEQAEQLLRGADAARQHAKSHGGNCRELLTEPLQEQARERLHRRAALRRAVTDHTLQVVYQPIVSLPDQRTVTVEALARWSQPPGSSVPPGAFIAIAEQTGLIHDLGLQVLDRACGDLARRRVTTTPSPRVAVNVSPRQLLADTFPADVLTTLHRHGLPTAAIELEITESSAMEEAGPTRTTLKRLADAGIALVIDDFGTGYSPFSALHDLPFSGLKIDRSFITRLPDDAATAAVVEAIVAMAAHLGLQVTAEGVETPEQLTLVAALGCHYGQGYLLGRPQPAEPANPAAIHNTCAPPPTPPLDHTEP